MKKLILFVLLAFCCSGVTRAACTKTVTGPPNIWTAASANTSDVAACITAASEGDTINVPAGTVTWTSGVTIGKGLTINGAGTSRMIAHDNGSTLVAIGTGSKTFTIHHHYMPRFSSPRSPWADVKFSMWAHPQTGCRARSQADAGTGALVMSITSTSGSGTYAKWAVRTVPSTVTQYIDGTACTSQIPLFTINQDTVAKVQISNMEFTPGTTCRQSIFQINNANANDTGKKAWIHDTWIQVNPSLSTPGGAGTNPIESASNQFVFYNFSCESTVYEQAAFACPDITINRANPWSLTDKWGAADIGGAQNAYVEYGSYTAMGSSCDDTGGGMLVCRDLVFDNSSLSTHGADTGFGFGNKQMEIYRNQWIFDGSGTSNIYSQIPLAYFFEVRGGNFVFWGNTIPNPGSAYNPPYITLNVQNLRRDSGPDPCWGAGQASPAGQNYYSPRQIGYGNVTGLGTTTYIGAPPNPQSTSTARRIPLVPTSATDGLIFGGTR